ncbi:MAG: SIS domain-containing protein [Acidobacteria bacterium]|nr:SIS domain-containing protein [Acidobacteriota bacterium]
MLTQLAVIEGQYLRDILDQARALEDTLKSLEDGKWLYDLAARLRRGKYRTVVLTGMGSSFHALHPIHLKLIEHGLTATMVETSELIHYHSRLFIPETVIIAVSQSGQSAEVIRLLEMNRGKSAIVAVTNSPESPLARQANAMVLTRAGKEFSVSCKTYVTALMALKWLEDVLCERDLDRTRAELGQVAPAVESYLADWRERVQTLAALLTEVRHLFLVGRGRSLAAVGTGALIVKESDRIHAEGMSSAAFRHGPFEMLSPETFVLVFAGDSLTRHLNRRLLEDIRAQQGRACWVAGDSEVAACSLPQAPRTFLPIVEILPVQMITLALAAQAGREAGRFALASKITTTE